MFYSQQAIKHLVMKAVTVIKGNVCVFKYHMTYRNEDFRILFAETKSVKRQKNPKDFIKLKCYVIRS